MNAASHLRPPGSPPGAFHSGWRKFKSAAVSAVCLVAAMLVVAPLGLVLFHLVTLGAKSVDWHFFTNLPAPSGETGGGMANAIVGTLVLLALASIVGVPVGVLGGVYLSEYGSLKVNWGVRFVADILNGTPSIVWGIVVFALLAGSPIHRFSAYAGGLALGFLMIPLVIRTTEEMLALVPNGYREAAFALGIARWKIIVHIVMKTARRGIITGILVALARIAGETAPLLFTAFGNKYWNQNLNEPIASLPQQIFVYAISPYEDWKRQAWAGALVLLLLVLFVNIGVRFLTRGNPGMSAK